ncbi:acyl-CoA dehydrogenase family protein [Streptomyces syringium]|uniref:Alkylation response protein AidB-like acyl-CoA dehydrogenase n=1 Tax=Streptomyces syringium TaxID=76729 RepID=A0ABS4Y748_9ACTN|nr:acyl-CoA dehydrogenase family protein [Streptomyces syringium]MBP2404620.1 alkylation response protein AidB-like acyl-CoA dehydrogenase [Streptomyces syringium]
MRVSEGDVAGLVRSRWGGLLAEIGGGAVERYAEGVPVPKKWFADAGALGLQAFPLPAAVAGADADAVTWGRALEEIGYLCADPAFPVVVSIHTGIASLLCATGNAHLVHTYALPISRGACLPALAFSEGTDLLSMRTELTATGSDFRLSGRKEFITGGLLADVFLTYASDRHGDLVACLVPAHDDGVEVVPARSAGFRTAGAASVTFKDVRVPADRVMTSADGLSHAQQYLNSRRAVIASFTTGQMRRLLESTVTRLQDSVRYGQRLMDLPNVQAAVGRMYVSVEASRSIVHRALTRLDAGDGDPFFDPVVSAAKHHVTEQALAVLNEAFRVLGGHAYYGDPHYGMFLREAFGLLAGAGTQDLLEINLGMCAAQKGKNLA